MVNKLMEYAGPAIEREVSASPHLPTSGRILGVLVKSMRLSHPMLRSKNAQRYFSGRQDNLVKESSRSEIVEAAADSLAYLGFAPPPRAGEATSGSVLATLLDWHARLWDGLRTFLLPRMSRVYPSHLPAVWRTYVRLAAIDLALRVTAHLHLAGATPSSLDFLEWICSKPRGNYLNELRKNAGVTLFSLSEAVEVTESAAEGWVYQNVRPSDDNLVKIGRTLAGGDDTYGGELLVRDLRKFYWISDIAELLGEHIGAEAVEEILARLHRYAVQAYAAINNDSSAERSPANLTELASLGAKSGLARRLLAGMAKAESDDEWQEDLSAVSTDWVRRLLSANLQIDQAEVDVLIQKTDGRILENWDISNPKAYEHYQRSMELQMQGRRDEALAHVIKAVELDPLDPANHFTLGSVKGGMGTERGDKVLIEEGLKACWIAVALDPNWILPWTEIGWLLAKTGKPKEAIEHLRAVSPECGPLDARYYAALGVALRELGDFTDSLAAFESSLKLNPNDMSVAVAATGVALLAGDKLRSNQHRKVARHLGATHELDRQLEMVKAVETLLPKVVITEDPERDISHLDAAIRRNPGNATAYIARGRAYFAKGDDNNALSDLDAAIRINPSDPAGYVIRGILHGEMNRHDKVVSDMSEVIRLKPESAMAHYYRGLARGEQDALDLAIADLDKAIRLDPKHVDAYRARGDCRLYKKDYDQAISDYDSALRLDPKHARSYRGRGAVHRRKGEIELAITDYDAAVRLNPEDDFAFRFRGDAYLAKRDYGQALSDFDASLKLNGTDEAAYRGRGSAYLFSGKPELAIVDFNAAVECYPESAVAIHGRGVAREVMGDAEGAESDYHRARELGYSDSV